MNKINEEKSENKKIEFKFGLIIFRTKKFSFLFDVLGSKKITKGTSWIALYLMPIIAAIGIYILFFSISVLLTTPEAREAGRETGAQSMILIPGLNPFLPIVYGWIGIVVGIIIHEGAHGIVARSLGFEVKSSGLLFFLILPIGAFVEVNESQMANGRARESVRVMAAGPGANIAVAILSLLAILIIISGISPAVNGLLVVGIVDEMPAQKVGIVPNDVILEVEDVRIKEIKKLKEVLAQKEAGDSISIRLLNLQNWKEKVAVVNLAETNSGPQIGVQLVAIEPALESSLENYRHLSLSLPIIHLIPPTFPAGQGLHPYSDTFGRYYQHSWLDEFYLPVTNLLFWIWFVNVNLAIFNALPIYPLDGGQAFRYCLQKGFSGRIGDRGSSIITRVVTLILVLAVLSLFLFPYF